MGHGNNGVDVSLKLSWLQSRVDLNGHFALHKVSTTREMGPVNGQAPFLSTLRHASLIPVASLYYPRWQSVSLNRHRKLASSVLSHCPFKELGWHAYPLRMPVQPVG